MMEENKASKAEAEVSLSPDGLSLKAKGTGLIAIILSSILGIVLISCWIATTNNFYLFFPMAFLAYVVREGLASLDGLFGLRRIYRDDD